MSERVNVLSPEFRQNPYPHYAELRRTWPVCQVEPGGMWAVSRYEDVLFVLKHPEIFSQGFKDTWQPPWVGYNPLANSMMALDPPAHTRLRSLVSRAFGPQVIARIEPRLRRLAAELAEGLGQGEEVDFVEAFAMPLPAFVIGELLGLDHTLRPRFKRWGDDITSITPEPKSPDDAARVRQTIADLTGYLAEVVAARRRAPVDDLVSDLVQARVDGLGLSDQEIIELLVMLLLGGLETTMLFLGSTLLFLAQHPEWMTRLCEVPALLPRFLEEMLRYDGPSQALPRLVTTEVTLSGVTLPRGALVLALVASANHDERQFPDPERFDPERGSQGGLQFGHGIHFCIGALLGRMEARVGLEALLARFRRVERTAGTVHYNRMLPVRGPVTLPLRFFPA